MLNYFLKRFGLMIITFIISVFLFFFFFRMMPSYKQIPYQDPNLAKILERQREIEGWDKPIPVQFWRYVKGIILRGDFGWSTVYQRNAAEAYFPKLPATITFQLTPYILSTIIGISLGILAALKKNKLADNIISVGIIILISAPSFVVAVLGQYIFVWKLKLFPQIYVATTDQVKELGIGFWFQTNALPIFIMTLTGCVGWARSVRAELTEQLTQDYMLLARSKGLSHTQATVRHALKNALVPFAPSIFLGFVGLLSGSMVLEQVFRVEGTAKIYLAAFNQKDISLLLLIVIFSTFLGFLMAILGDLSYTLLDPRMRVGSKK